MPTETVIEDDGLRCTVLGAQPTGVTSRNGALMLMVDREMINDDGKGLGYYEASEQILEHLLYPADLFQSSGAQSSTGTGVNTATALPPLPSNIQLINARYIAPGTVLISMRKLPFDCSTKPSFKTSTNTDLLRQFFESFQGSIFESNLTGTKTGKKVSPQMVSNYFDYPLHIVTFLLKFDQIT
ncbi:unnamed protein product [Gongylonema pulchrum]|uniref:GMC_oxred_C domain-containing protein n=1 Tax=Gongylonema pulchrum TaxID=637853 RepID=A0A183CZ01_9BILA|nr:unnamed protein product [Gongylonema pulchrum]